MKTKLTVLLPVYNGERFLKACIDSILNQSFENYKFIIINDGSQDSSNDIINNYNDERIQLINNNNNLGLTETLNKGLHIAKTNYIARIDQDDTSEKDRLQQQMQYLKENRSVKLIGCWGKIIDENDSFIKSIHYPSRKSKILEAFVSYNPFIHSSVIFDKEIALKFYGYPKSFVHAQDFYLWYNITSQFEVYNIPEELVNIRWHNQRATEGEFNSIYILKEALHVYNLAIKNPEINSLIRLKGKMRVLLKPWYFRKILGLKPK